ncbi:hypothetical protein [Ruminococcus sp. Marseille-P6503]|uniref:hypothetical protein n=1 Tax=Ruminococcus sp. Marseille-P6503 TaxID=2364796 RepID=UPI000F5470A2|nr:hypothetical protein [Ruminococcus sp. Marseille-P6503]
MKKTCIAFQIILLVWFFLDMIGIYFGDKCLVTQSYKEDGLFFLIYLITIILFIIKDKIGKWIVAVWTSIWFVIQFLCHEWYTIFNGGIMGSLEGKIKYFSETVQWIKIEGKYIPDIYHTVLHILLLLVIITTFMFIKKTGNKEQ